MDNQRLILFLIFSFSLVMLWEAWQKQGAPGQVATPPAATATVAAPAAGGGSAPVPVPTAETIPVAAAAAAPVDTAAKLRVTTDLFVAEVSAQGGDLTRLEFRAHHATGDKDSNFVLFEAKHAYAAQAGMIGPGLPTHKSVWQLPASGVDMKDGDQELRVRLTAPAVDGVQVAKTYIFKRGSYLIDVEYEITNNSPAAIAPHAYFQLTRDGQAPEGANAMMSTFTGPAFYTEADKFQKSSFEDVTKKKAKVPGKTDNGWVAMVQHYFVAAWLPGTGEREYFLREIGKDLYAAGVIVPVAQIAPGATGKIAVPLYAGPQEQDKLAKVAPGFDLVVDYGWLTVVAAPLFWVLQWLHGFIGNWGWAIILLTVLIKGAFFPLSAASYKSMAKMRLLTPKLQKLKETYGDDKQRLNQEMMEMYKKEKVNPLGGCLPILVQIPVFIALYWVLMGTVEMRGAPWILWITDLSAADTLFGRIPLINLPLGPLPLLMGATMFIQTKLNPTPPDPIQAKIMLWMPIVFTFMFLGFPAGLVLYWTINNLLSIAQQWQVNRMIEASGLKANSSAETIAALATAPGRGGIGVVRVSGTGLLDFAARLTGKRPPPRRATMADFCSADGTPIDRGILLYFPAPHSFTGEDVLELQGHGGPVVMQELVGRCRELGARLAEPGEFTRRAFLNDKLDLAQAEAVADLIEASTAQAARSALRSLSGEFSQQVHGLVEQLIDLRMLVEATLDFPDEEIDPLRDTDMLPRLDRLRAGLGVLRGRARQGSLLRTGLTVVLAGVPNVGKSSLLNRLAGEERAIVTEIAGTTRDALKETIQVEGIPLHIIDTAGLRETEDEVERLGIERSWREIAKADVVLQIVDARGGVTPADRGVAARLPAGIERVVVENKCDLAHLAAGRFEAQGQVHLRISAKTGEGMALLHDELLRVAGWQGHGEDVILARERHLAALAEAEGRLELAAASIGQQELAAEELRLAQEALAGITGEFSADDLLGVIFSRFCIGK